jgi:hypothetical protein
MAKILNKLSKEAAKLKTAILAQYTLDEDSAGLAILDEALKCWDEANLYQGIIQNDGPTIRTMSREVKPHPLLKELRGARAQFFMGMRLLNLELEADPKPLGRPPRQGHGQGG